MEILMKTSRENNTHIHNVQLQCSTKNVLKAALLLYMLGRKRERKSWGPYLRKQRLCSPIKKSAGDVRGGALIDTEAVSVMAA